MSESARPKLKLSFKPVSLASTSRQNSVSPGHKSDDDADDNEDMSLTSGRSSRVGYPSSNNDLSEDEMEDDTDLSSVTPVKRRQSEAITSIDPRRGKSKSTRLHSKRRSTVTPGLWKPKKKGLYTVLDKLISALKHKDHYGFFLEPVDTSIVKDYLTVVKTPMDLGTMDMKVQNRQYRSCEAFLSDFELVIKNAKTYNLPHTMFYKAADRLGSYGFKLIDREAATIEDRVHGGHMHSLNGELPSLNNDSTKVEVRRRSKKSKQTDDLEHQMAEQYAPDGTLLGEDGSTVPRTPIPPDYLPESWHTQTEIPTFGVRDFGPYQWRIQPQAETHPLLVRTVFGDVTGEAYVRSLEAFVRHCGPQVKDRAAEVVDDVTQGARQFMRKVEEHLSHPKERERVSTPWGDLDVEERVKELRAEADTTKRRAEAEEYGKQGVLALSSILIPAGLGISDPQLAMEVQSSSVVNLLGNNTEDMKHWLEKASDTVLAERIRRRLLHLVQKAPAKEFEQPVPRNLSIEMLRAYGQRIVNPPVFGAGVAGLSAGLSRNH
ncbi:hypothetical protein BC832DRAFT_179339 [Gaertneriomyces semiglobifer]|nr:hypothetical protein BC832DRAFT_179339 [Gaertneriomyces semiglobifer]